MSVSSIGLTTAPRPKVFEPARLGPQTLRNRIVKAATFEGRTPRVGGTLEDVRVAVTGGTGFLGAHSVAAPCSRTPRTC